MPGSAIFNMESQERCYVSTVEYDGYRQCFELTILKSKSCLLACDLGETANPSPCFRFISYKIGLLESSWQHCVGGRGRNACSTWKSPRTVSHTLKHSEKRSYYHVQVQYPLLLNVYVVILRSRGRKWILPSYPFPVLFCGCEAGADNLGGI